MHMPYMLTSVENHQIHLTQAQNGSCANIGLYTYGPDQVRKPHDKITYLLTVAATMTGRRARRWFDFQLDRAPGVPLPGGVTGSLTAYHRGWQPSLCAGALHVLWHEPCKSWAGYQRAAAAHL